MTNESAKQAELDQLDSKERKLRFGQVKMLRALKRAAAEETKKQKRLKTGDSTKIEIQLPDEDEMDEEEKNKIDITD